MPHTVWTASVIDDSAVYTYLLTKALAFNIFIPVYKVLDTVKIR